VDPPNPTIMLETVDELLSISVEHAEFLMLAAVTRERASSFPGV
jgi:hypothetical protein